MTTDFLDKFAKVPGDRPAGIDELARTLKAEQGQDGSSPAKRTRYRKPRVGGPVTVFSVRIPEATRQAIEAYAQEHSLSLGEAVERLVLAGTNV